MHDIGAISAMSSDSQAMGRVGEVITRTWQTADKVYIYLVPCKALGREKIVISGLRCVASFRASALLRAGCVLLLVSKRRLGYPYPHEVVAWR